MENKKNYKVLKVLARGFVALFDDGRTMYVQSAKVTDKGKIGDGMEIAVKLPILGFDNEKAQIVASAGGCDLIDNIDKHGKYYDSKQNGTVVKYAQFSKMIRGSSRVIYATHVAVIILDTYEKDDEMWQDIAIDLKNSELFVVDRDAFVHHLVNNGYAKKNAARHEINIQSLYNYKKDAYHGRKGKVLEKWLRENHNDPDNILGRVLAGYR